MGKRWFIGRNKSGEDIPPHSVVSLVKDFKQETQGLRVSDSGEWEFDIYKPRVIDEFLQDPSLLAVTGPDVIGTGVNNRGCITQDWPARVALNKPRLVANGWDEAFSGIDQVIAGPAPYNTPRPGNRVGVKRDTWGVSACSGGAFNIIFRELTEDGTSQNPLLNGTKFKTAIITTIRDVRYACLGVVDTSGSTSPSDDELNQIEFIATQHSGANHLLTPFPDGIEVYGGPQYGIPPTRTTASPTSIVVGTSGTFMFSFAGEVKLGTPAPGATRVVVKPTLSRSPGANAVPELVDENVRMSLFKDERYLPYSVELSVPGSTDDLSSGHHLPLALCGLVNAQANDLLRFLVYSNGFVEIRNVTGFLLQVGPYLGYSGQRSNDVR